jgi:hypothetical protein
MDVQRSIAGADGVIKDHALECLPRSWRGEYLDHAAKLRKFNIYSNDRPKSSLTQSAGPW